MRRRSSPSLRRRRLFDALLTAMPRGYAPRGAADFLERCAVDDAEVVAAPVVDKHVLVVRGDGDILRYLPTCATPLIARLCKFDAVHVARAEPLRSAAVVVAFGTEVRAVHRVVRRVDILWVASTAASTGAPFETPGWPLMPNFAGRRSRGSSSRASRSASYTVIVCGTSCSARTRAPCRSRSTDFGEIGSADRCHVA